MILVNRIQIVGPRELKWQAQSLPPERARRKLKEYYSIPAADGSSANATGVLPAPDHESSRKLLGGSAGVRVPENEYRTWAA